jgi:hypothetical protein
MALLDIASTDLHVVVISHINPLAFYWLCSLPLRTFFLLPYCTIIADSNSDPSVMPYYIASEWISGVTLFSTVPRIFCMYMFVGNGAYHDVTL